MNEQMKLPNEFPDDNISLVFFFSLVTRRDVGVNTLDSNSVGLNPVEDRL